MSVLRSPQDYVEAIRESGKTIYDPIEVGSDLYIPSLELEAILDGGLRGFDTAGLPNRTRSKVVKSRICELLGYPVPKSFKKKKPRFTGQYFDTYVQASNNLQIWNEESEAKRRYVIIQEIDQKITRVRVVTGIVIAKLDATGTLTKKYQARLIPGAETAELVSATDTNALIPLLAPGYFSCAQASPVSYPEEGKLLPIATVFEILSPLIGRTFPDAGHNQERNRGAALHRLVCDAIGYPNYQDDGQFPDLKHQLLEVKLQTAPTIDLGLVLPSSEDPIDAPKIGDVQVQYRDVRYAIFGASTDGTIVTLNSLHLSTGEGFFARFQQFQGNVVNAKLQMRIPSDFFDRPNAV